MHIKFIPHPAQITQLPKYMADTVSIEADIGNNIAQGEWRRCTKELAAQVEKKLESQIAAGEEPDADYYHKLAGVIRRYAEPAQDDPLEVRNWKKWKRADPSWDGWFANVMPSDPPEQTTEAPDTAPDTAPDICEDPVPIAAEITSSTVVRVVSAPDAQIAPVMISDEKPEEDLAGRLTPW